jgi:putative heme iron utilization protein
MSSSPEVVGEALALLQRSQQGVLSTVSQKLGGYPFGSVITFSGDRRNRPVILISDIAEHTKNIVADPRVSITVIEGGDDIQASGRLTVVGNAKRIADSAQLEDAAQRFYRRFPQAVDYHRFHDFHFYCIEPTRLRYIGGFGRIHWVEASAVLAENPFSESQELPMIDHMNSDHAAAISDYCRLYGVDPVAETPRLSAIDGHGFDVMIGKRLLRIPFDAPVTTAAEVRAALVSLARRARSAESAA